MRKRVLGWIAFAIPFLVALSMCGASPGWLDAPEFVAASASLGLSHPPGHPSYLLFSHFFALFPLGSIAFRVALFSSFCLGLACWLTYRLSLLLIVLVRQKVALDWHERVISCLVCITCALTYTCLLQGVRAEVYTFHAALMMAMLERLLSAYCQMKGLQHSTTLSAAPQEDVPLSDFYTTQSLRLEEDEPPESGVLSAMDDDPFEAQSFEEKGVQKKLWSSYFWRRGGRDLCLAAFWGGIGLANHHYLTLLMLPGCLILLTCMGWRRLWGSFTLLVLGALLTWGLLTYTYLPARSVSQPSVHWGEAFSAKGWFWYVSAKAWQGSIRTSNTKQSLGQRTFLLAYLFIEQIGELWFLLLFLGFYIVCRLSLSVGLAFLCWWGIGVLGRVVMVVDRFDADLHGYMIVSMLLVACILATLLTMAWDWVLQVGRKLERRKNPKAGTPRWSILVGLLLIGGTMLTPWKMMSDAIAVPGLHPYSLSHCDRSNSWASLLWIELSEEPLPLDTLVFSSNYQTGFLRWYRQVVERHRPDLFNFPRNLMGLKGFALIESNRNPMFHPLYLAFSEKKGNRFAVVEDFSTENPICLEWYQDLPPDFSKNLYPSGSLFCWLPHSQRPTWNWGRASDDAAVMEQQQYFWNRVYQKMKPYLTKDRELRKVLLWTHFQHAKFYWHSGRWLAGLKETERAMRLVPRAPELNRMLSSFRKKLSKN